MPHDAKLKMPLANTSTASIIQADGIRRSATNHRCNTKPQWMLTMQHEPKALLFSGAAPTQLAVHRWPIGRLPGSSGSVLRRWKQTLLQRRIVEISCKRPTETGTFRTDQILTRRRPPDAQAGRNLTPRLPRRLQAQSILDLPHWQSLHWPPASIKGKRR
ncbi:MAG: hypothetical protein ACI8W8_003822 [Rhodothermales bacterium]|jgi:hypothetical protein